MLMTAVPAAARHAASPRDTRSRVIRVLTSAVVRVVAQRSCHVWRNIRIRVGIRIDGRRIEVPAVANDPPPTHTSKVVTVHPTTAVPALDVQAVVSFASGVGNTGRK